MKPCLPGIPKRRSPAAVPAEHRPPRLRQENTKTSPCGLLECRRIRLAVPGRRRGLAAVVRTTSLKCARCADSRADQSSRSLSPRPFTCAVKKPKCSHSQSRRATCGSRASRAPFTANAPEFRRGTPIWQAGAAGVTTPGIRQCGRGCPSENRMVARGPPSRGRFARGTAAYR